MQHALLLLLLAAPALTAQETGCVLEIVAGGGKSFSGDGGPAVLAEFDHPQDAVARPDGSIYVADTGNGRVRWISPDGVITTVLRTPEPARIAVSPEGDLFVFDRTQRRIIRRQTNGFVRTVLADAGLGAEVGIDAGPGPTLYLADAENHRVLRLERSGELEVVADNDVGLRAPSDVAFAPDGSVYAADGAAARIWSIRPDGMVAIFADIVDQDGFLGPTPQRPYRLAADPDGRVVALTAVLLDSFAPVAGTRLWLIPSRTSPPRDLGLPTVPGVTAIDWVAGDTFLMLAGIDDRLYTVGVETSKSNLVAGAGVDGPSGDGGPAREARLRAPSSVAALSTGEVFVADQGRVRVVGLDGVIREARPSLPFADLASDGNDNLFVANWDAILKRSPGGAVEIVATSRPCSIDNDCGDGGPAAKAGFHGISRIAAEPDGGLWVVDGLFLSSALRFIATDGIISRRPFPPNTRDGPIVLPFASVGALGSDSRGGVLAADNQRIQRFSPTTQSWAEVAGSHGFTHSVDSTSARHAIADAAGNVYFTTGRRIGRLTPEGKMNTLVGLEEGSPLRTPDALALTGNGDLLVSDSEAGTVFRLHEAAACDRVVRPQIYVTGFTNVARNQVALLIRNFFLPTGQLLDNIGAPGMVASVYGVRLGPAEGAASDYRSAGSIPTELEGVSAMAAGQPAGILYASQEQVNLVLPFDLPESGDVWLAISVDGVPSDPVAIRMKPSWPGVLAVLNPDGQPNSVARPAIAGQEVSVLVSGLGRPTVEADALASAGDIVPWETSDIEILVRGGSEGSVAVSPLWARSRPGQPASLVEIGFRIPDTADIMQGNTPAWVRRRSGEYARFEIGIVRAR